MYFTLKIKIKVKVTNLKEVVIQWSPLIVITVNVVILLIFSIFYEKIRKPLVILKAKLLFGVWIMLSFGYCYQLQFDPTAPAVPTHVKNDKFQSQFTSTSKNFQN